jgi:hypothetical protein
LLLRVYELLVMLHVHEHTLDLHVLLFGTHCSECRCITLISTVAFGLFCYRAYRHFSLHHLYNRGDGIFWRLCTRVVGWDM